MVLVENRGWWSGVMQKYLEKRFWESQSWKFQPGQAQARLRKYSSPAAIATTVGIGLGAVGAMALPAQAEEIVLDFEGLLDLELVEEFYNGGEGSLGSAYAQDLGVSFSGNVIALKDIDAGGSVGDFGGEPSPDNIIFFREGDAATVNVAAGFKSGFSLFYSAVVAAGSPPSNRGSVQVFDGIDASGSLLAQFNLPSTPSSGNPDPNGEFSPFVPLGVQFSGLARSVRLSGEARTIGFDNLTLGSAVPRLGSFEPIIPDIPDGMSPLHPDLPSPPQPQGVPEPRTWMGLGLVGLWMLSRRARSAQRSAGKGKI